MATRRTVTRETGYAERSDSEHEQSDGEESKRYLVTCEACSLEEAVEGRSGAVDTGSEHREETGHDVVVLEWPL